MTDAGPGRDAALLATVLADLRGQLEQSADDGQHSPDVEALVSGALAELQRAGALEADNRGGIAPVLGTGVLQELLRRARQRLGGGDASAAADADIHVDIRR
ncbi:MAG: hypothetical protein ACT4OZ_11260 [Gemmatimonadota bacterium]